MYFTWKTERVGYETQISNNNINTVRICAGMCSAKVFSDKRMRGIDRIL